MPAPTLLSPAAAAAAFGARAREACKDIIETLRRATDDDATTSDDPTSASEPRYLGVLFEKLPTRKMFPDYYRVIARPIDIKSINGHLRKGVAAGGYQSCREFANAVVGGAHSCECSCPI